MSSRKPEVAEAALGVKAARAAGRATAARGATEVPAMELLRSGATLATQIRHVRRQHASSTITPRGESAIRPTALSSGTLHPRAAVAGFRKAVGQRVAVAIVQHGS
jgi:hypothetical protein